MRRYVTKIKTERKPPANALRMMVGYCGHVLCTRWLKPAFTELACKLGKAVDSEMDYQGLMDRFNPKRSRVFALLKELSECEGFEIH